MRSEREQWRRRRRRCIFRATTRRFIIHAKTLKLQFISRRSRSLRAPPLCIVISSSIKNREVALPDPTAPRPPLCSLRVISSRTLSLLVAMNLSCAALGSVLQTLMDQTLCIVLVAHFCASSVQCTRKPTPPHAAVHAPYTHTRLAKDTLFL